MLFRSPHARQAIIKYHRLISALSERGFCDLVCAVLAVDLSGGAQPELGPVAYVWDGTVLPPDVVLQRGKVEPLPSWPRHGSILPVSFPSPVSELFRTVVADRRCTGEASSDSSAAASPACQFVKLRNVGVERDAVGKMYVRFHSNSALYALSTQDAAVAPLLQRLRP